MWCNKMRKINLLLIMAVIFILSGCIKNTKKYEEELRWQIKSNYYASEVSQDNKGYYVIQLENTDTSISSLIGNVPDAYVEDINVDVVLEEISIGESDKKKRVIKKINTFYIDIYDIKTNKKMNKIDVKKMFKDISMDNARLYLDSYGNAMYNSKLCEYFTVDYFMPDSDQSIKRTFYISVEDGEMEEGENEAKDNIKSNYINKEDTLPYLLTVQNVNQSKWGFRIEYSGWEDRVEISTDIEQIPGNNEKLHDLYPKLKEHINRLRTEEKKARITFVLPNNMKEEEIMELLLPSGQEILFDGLIIDAANSVDGLPHKIYSFDDFRKYLAPKERSIQRLKPIIRK